MNANHEECTVNGDDAGAVAAEPSGKSQVRIWFDRCMLLLFLTMIAWALVATYRFHAPFDGFSILFLALIAGVVCRPTRRSS